MQTIHVQASRPYDIVIGRGLLDKAGSMARQVNSGARALIVSDSHVAPLYADRVLAGFREAGYAVSLFTFEAGEERKRLSTVQQVYARLAAENLTRGDLLVALGGGVTGDLTGFAAATWLRGIDFIQLPTSLLSQVDSSVGGKTGVDIPEGKNLVGAFWQPRLVAADIDTLSTLPPDFLADGMAEVIKAACIQDAAFFADLEKGDALSPEKAEDTVRRAVDIKRRVVEADERESGQRKLLNFGHTLGHALEKHYNYRYSHGKAVGVGMMLVTRAAERAGLTPTGTADRIAALFARYGLPSGDPVPPEAYLAHAALDKKRSADGLDLILLREIGQGFVHPLPLDRLAPFIL